MNNPDRIIDRYNVLMRYLSNQSDSSWADLKLTIERMARTEEPDRNARVTRDDTYNDWTNKPTWLVKVWIDNDQLEQEFWLAQTRRCLALPPSESGVGQPRYGTYRLADILKDHFETRAEALTGVTGFWADLLSYTVAIINWDEIARVLVEDAEEI